MDQERAVSQTGLEQDSDPTFDPRPSSGFEDMEESEEIDKFEDLESEEEDDDEDEDEDEDGFTFACAVDDDSSFTADDMFDNGKIRPVFPLFDQNLVDLPHLPPVKNVFVAAGAPPLPLHAAEGSGEEPRSYCAWPGKTVEADTTSPEACKKSNSTGFSKIWRFKEMTNRSHSDGRDAFVFLNKLVSNKKKKGSTAAAAGGKAATAVATKKKGGGKGKKVATSISAHEVYVKSRAAATREEDRRRTYLPYKPVGFFTNVHCGMSKNVHPF